MDFMRYHEIRRPGESFEQYEHRLKKFRRVQEEKELGKIYRSTPLSMSGMSGMSGMGGIDGRNESYEEYRFRIDREILETELQITKQNRKKLILLLLWVYTKTY